MTAGSGPQRTPSLPFLVALIFLATVAHGQGSSNTAKQPIKVADSVAMTRLGAPDYSAGSSPVAHFSPDGKRFVVVLRKGNLQQNTNEFSLLLYRAVDALNSSKPDVLVKMSSSSNRDAIAKVRWLLDNETLVFLGENPGEVPQLCTFNLTTRLLKKLTSHPTAVTNYDVTQDGKEIAFAAEPLTRTPTGKEGSSSGEIVIAGLSLFDVLTGNYSRREGRQLFWEEMGHSPRPVPVGPEYFVSGFALSLSPDGRYIAFPASILNTQSHSTWANYQDKDKAVQQIFASDFPGGRISPLQQYLLFDSKEMSVAPLVDAPMLGYDPVWWAQDGKSVFLTSYLPLGTADPTERNARKQNKYPTQVSLPSRECRRVSREDFPVNVTQTAPLDVKLEQDANTPPKLYVTNPGGGQKQLLLDLNTQFRQLNFGTVRTIEWEVDGITIIGGLYLPPDYVLGERYPLVIQTHGFEPMEFSMDGRSEWSSGFAARPMAARNIAVLQTHKFKDQQSHDSVGDNRKLGATPQESFRNFTVHSYEKAIEYLDREEIIDPRHVGIIGFSRTACFVGYALTHSNYRFAAASVVDGISCGYFEEIAVPEEAWDINNINGGAPPFSEGLKLWMKNSPGFNLDKVQTPVRLVALGNGSALSLWEWYAGLTLQKKPVDFVLIPSAAHIGVKLSDRILAQQGIVDWFSFWLKGEEDPDPAKAEQYARWRELRKLQVKAQRRR